MRCLDETPVLGTPQLLLAVALLHDCKAVEFGDRDRLGSHREAGDIARRFYRLSAPIGTDDIFEEKSLELQEMDEPPEMDGPDSFS